MSPAELRMILLAVTEVAVAAPSDGVVSVGEVARTTLPVPVELDSVSTIDPAVFVHSSNPVAGVPVQVLN